MHSAQQPLYLLCVFAQLSEMQACISPLNTSTILWYTHAHTRTGHMVLLYMRGSGQKSTRCYGKKKCKPEKHKKHTRLKAVHHVHFFIYLKHM